MIGNHLRHIRGRRIPRSAPIWVDDRTIVLRPIVQGVGDRYSRASSNWVMRIMAAVLPHILGIPGSLRQGSYSGAVLRGLQAVAADRARIEVLTLEHVPLYNADLDGDRPPESVVALKRAIHDCDGLVLSSPEYNYGVSGVLKNALDWASRPGYQSVLKDKPVLILTSSPGMVGGARAHAQLRQTLGATLSRVVAVPEVLIAQVHSKIQDGRLADTTSLKFVLEAFDALLATIQRLPATQR